MRRRAAWALAACLMAPALAHAQTEPVSDAVALAEGFYRRGVEALRAGHEEQAIEALNRSYELAPTPTALYNLGLAHNGLRHDLATMEYMERYLRDAGAEVDPRRAAAIGQLLAEIRRRLVMVEVRLRPEGAAVSVDGHAARVRDGVLWVEPGARVLRASAEGYVATLRDLDGHAGERVEWSVNLAPVPPPVVALPPPRVTTPHPPTPVASPPIYTRWWFWTGVGVVVAGVATAAVVAATAHPDGWFPDTRFQVETLTLRR